MRHCAKCGQSQTVTRSDAEDNTCHYCGAATVKSSGVQGYLYILSNPSMPGLLKIGLTTRPVPERVAELSAATGVPGAFRLEAYFESSDPQMHESSVHQRLAPRRVPCKEFFRVGLDEAIEVAHAVTGQIPLGQIRQLTPDERFLQSLREEILRSGRAAPEIWRCSSCLHSFFGPLATSRCPRCGYGPVQGPS
jgi:ribosomal protein L37AE/L43A